MFLRDFYFNFKKQWIVLVRDGKIYYGYFWNLYLIKLGVYEIFNILVEWFVLFLVKDNILFLSYII